MLSITAPKKPGGEVRRYGRSLQRAIFVIRYYVNLLINIFAVGRESEAHPAFSSRRRENETHPAFGNWVKPNLCRNIFAPLFLAVRSASRSIIVM
jgi:hypothetical protein